MEWEIGQVVRSLAGRDKASFLVVLELAPPYAVVCDGKHRPLERPKRKKLLHLAPTGTVLPQEAVKTNGKIRKALRPFQDGAHR